MVLGLYDTMATTQTEVFAIETVEHSCLNPHTRKLTENIGPGVMTRGLDYAPGYFSADCLCVQT